MSTTGERRQGRPKARPGGADAEGAAQPGRLHRILGQGVPRRIGSPGFPTDEHALRVLADASTTAATTRRGWPSWRRSWPRAIAPSDCAPGRTHGRYPRQGRPASPVPGRRGHRACDLRRAAGGDPGHGARPRRAVWPQLIDSGLRTARGRASDGLASPQCVRRCSCAEPPRERQRLRVELGRNQLVARRVPRSAPHAPAQVAPRASSETAPAVAGPSPGRAPCRRARARRALDPRLPRRPPHRCARPRRRGAGRFRRACGATGVHAVPAGTVFPLHLAHAGVDAQAHQRACDQPGRDLEPSMHPGARMWLGHRVGVVRSSRRGRRPPARPRGGRGAKPRPRRAHGGPTAGGDRVLLAKGHHRARSGEPQACGQLTGGDAPEERRDTAVSERDRPAASRVSGAGARNDQ